jgi:thymidine kinase
VVGPMFSGKSEELIRRLRRAEFGRQRVQIFKPVIDQRYAKNGIVSHSGLEIASELVQTGDDILQKVAPRTEVVGVDEAQFLGESVVDACVRLADLGKRVIVAGLDTDFMGRPFEPMPRLLAVAEEITKLLAICMRCGNPAVHTQRLVASEELIVVGAGGMYEARCPAENRGRKGKSCRTTEIPGCIQLDRSFFPLPATLHPESESLFTKGAIWLRIGLSGRTCTSAPHS